MRGCFAYLAILYFGVGFGTIRSLFRGSPADHAHELSQQTFRLQLAVVLHEMTHLLPLVLAVLFARAWWSLRKGKPSARNWAIAGSVALMTSIIPLVSAAFSMAPDGHSRMGLPVLIICCVYLGLGIAGLFAFAKKGNQAIITMEALPPRVKGDGTHRILDALALVLQAGGVFAIASRWTGWAFEKDLPIARGWESWVQWGLGLAGVTFIHESAHALVGMAVGMKLGAFVIGPFHWQLEEGCWKFRFRVNQFFAVSGAAGLVPTDPDLNRWKEAAMIAAGPIANLITGAAAAAFAYFAVDRPWEAFWEYFALFATLSLIVFVTNLIPFRPGALYSDGARIYQLFRLGPVSDYQRAVKSVTSTLVSPRRPRDYDIATILRASEYFGRGQQALTLRLWAMSHYKDIGADAMAATAFADAERIYQESASDISANLHSVFVINAVLLRRDAIAARAWWQRMQAKKIEKFNNDYWLAKCAFHWTKNDLAAARGA
jgi:hypothetical protein